MNPEKLATAPSKSLKVLVVDDDSDIRSLTRTFLEHEGYTVYSSGDAARAAQIFSRSPGIHLLVTDYSMPQRSGFDLAKELSSLQPSLRVLIISGVILSSTELAQIQTNCWRFLPKPFSLPQLLAEIHNILSPAPYDDRSATLIA
jgi:DNA-binding NtrC family response regulator